MNKNLQTTFIFVVVSVISFVVMICPTSMTATAQNQQQSFQAKLSGNNEVPPVTTSATGMAQFQLSSNGKTLSYTLTANNIKTVIMAHLHQGKAGENGQPVVPLYVGKGIITSSNPQGKYYYMTGKQMSDLVNLIKIGQAYVNVNTGQNQKGEIRGQVSAVGQ